jgi:hypothetical protein
MQPHFTVGTWLVVLVATGSLSGCSKVYDGEQLSSKTLARLQRIGLLNPGEKIYQFYSNAPTQAAGAGNFYTSQRIAQYWLASDKRKTQLNFAYYKDIARLDTVYLAEALTYVSYMVVTRKDGSHFRVYVGGTKPTVSSFFEHATAHWRAATCSPN